MLNRRMFRPMVAMVLAAVVWVPVVGCSTNPATGRSQLNVLSREQEIAIGSEAGPEFLEQGGGELKDPVINEYVENIGRRMAAISEFPDLPWAFHVMDSEVINAFALPGGKVFISRGLLAEMTNEAQLAGVLGHEIGHVTARHANDRYAQQIAVTGLVVGASVAASQSDSDAVRYGVPAGTGLAGTLWTLSYGRNQEHESDSLGLRYMTRVGYDPMGQAQVMRILDQASEGPRPPEFLSTHPEPGNRAGRLEQIIQQEYAHTQNNPNFVLNAQRFQTTVLDRLAKLAPPQHTREELQAQKEKFDR